MHNTSPLLPHFQDRLNRGEPLEPLLWEQNLAQAVDHGALPMVERALAKLATWDVLDHLPWGELLQTAQIAVYLDAADAQGGPLRHPQGPAVHACLVSQPELPVAELWNSLATDRFKQLTPVLLAQVIDRLVEHPQARTTKTTTAGELGLDTLLNHAPDQLSRLLTAWTTPPVEPKFRGADALFRGAIRLKHEALAFQLLPFVQSNREPSWWEDTRSRMLNSELVGLYAHHVGQLDTTHSRVQSGLWLDVLTYRLVPAIPIALRRVVPSATLLDDHEPTSELWPALDAALTLTQAEDLATWRELVWTHGPQDRLPQLAHLHHANRRHAQLAQIPPQSPRVRPRA